MKCLGEIFEFKLVWIKFKNLVLLILGYKTHNFLLKKEILKFRLYVLQGVKFSKLIFGDRELVENTVSN